MASVESVLKLAIKHGPKLGVAATALGAFLSKNPEVAAWLRERASTMPTQLAEVRKRRGDAAQIRGMLEIVRDVAGKLRVDGADGADGGAGADGATSADWLRRADDIDLAVQLAERMGQPERRKALARLKTRSEALLDDLIEATTA